MTPVIRLDKSKQFGECRGERQPDDPHYKVHYWQGQKIGTDIILLPFDAQGVLVPDDGKTAPWEGKTSDNKPIVYSPLYTQAMRDLVARKFAHMAGAKPTPAAAGDGGTVLADEGSLLTNDDESAPEDDVNFSSWLKGDVQYDWPLMQKAGKKRFSRMFLSKKQMVEDLVIDEKVVREDEVCAELAKYLPPKAA